MQRSVGMWTEKTVDGEAFCSCPIVGLTRRSCTLATGVCLQPVYSRETAASVASSSL